MDLEVANRFGKILPGKYIHTTLPKTYMWHSPWKMVVGKLPFPFGKPYFQVWAVSFREAITKFCVPGLLGRAITSCEMTRCEWKGLLRLYSLNRLFGWNCEKTDIHHKVWENLGQIPMKEKATFTAFGTKRNPKWASLNSYGFLGVIVGRELFNCKTMTAANTSLHLEDWCWFQHNYHRSHIKNLGRHLLQTCKDQKPLRFDLSKCIRHRCQKTMWNDSSPHCFSSNPTPS